jgi:hypothetical protein
MKPILWFSAPVVLKTTKSVLMQARRWRTCKNPILVLLAPAALVTPKLGFKMRIAGLSNLLCA